MITKAVSGWSAKIQDSVDAQLYICIGSISLGKLSRDHDDILILYFLVIIRNSIVNRVYILLLIDLASCKSSIFMLIIDAPVLCE